VNLSVIALNIDNETPVPLVHNGFEPICEVLDKWIPDVTKGPPDFLGSRAQGEVNPARVWSAERNFNSVDSLRGACHRAARGDAPESLPLDCAGRL
jgi:hypothetical protein